jgi:hypothetical protein
VPRLLKKPRTGRLDILLAEWRSKPIGRVGHPPLPCQETRKSGFLTASGMANSMPSSKTRPRGPECPRHASLGLAPGAKIVVLKMEREPEDPLHRVERWRGKANPVFCQRHCSSHAVSEGRSTGSVGSAPGQRRESPANPQANSTVTLESPPARKSGPPEFFCWKIINYAGKSASPRSLSLCISISIFACLTRAHEPPAGRSALPSACP